MGRSLWLGCSDAVAGIPGFGEKKGNWKGKGEKRGMEWGEREEGSREGGREKEGKTLLFGRETGKMWAQQGAAQTAGLREGPRETPDSRDPRPCYSPTLSYHRI